MSFTVEDFADLVRLLRERPEWRTALLGALLETEPETLRTLLRAAVALAGLPTQVQALAEAQIRLTTTITQLEETTARLTEAVTRLAEAQTRAEERVTRLEEAVTRLAEAQARTEERVAALESRVGRLEEAVARLAEAQARTEERVAALESRVGRLEEAVTRLEGQMTQVEERVARVEERLTRVENAVGALQSAVGVLQHTIGVDMEAVARDVAEVVLTERGFSSRGDAGTLPVDSEGEVDVVWPVTAPDGRALWVLVEAKYRLHPADVRRWAERVRSEGFRQRLQATGVPGPYLVYAFGLGLDLRVPAEARQQKIGLLTPRGEIVAPAEEVAGL